MNQENMNYIMRGNEYINNGNTDKAIEEFNAAIRLNLGDADVYTSRGNAYHMKKEFDQAILDFDKAIQLDSGCVLAYLGRGNAYIGKKELNKAFENINEAIRLNPNDALAYIYRGAAYIEKGNFDQAIADINKGLQLDKDHVYNNLANAILETIRQRKNEKMARENFKHGNDNSIDNAENFFRKYKERVKVHYSHYCIANKMSGRQYNNNIIAKSAQLIQSMGAIGYIMRAFAHVGNDDLNNAIADLSAAIEKLPNNATSYEERGKVYGEKGDFDKSITDLDKSLQLKSDSADCYYFRGLAYLGKGNFEQAFTDCNKSLELKFLSPSEQLDAYLLRGFLYGKDGNLDKAIADFEAALRIKVENVGDGGKIEVESIFHDNAKKCLEYARQAHSDPELVKRLQQEKIEKQYKELLARKKTATNYEALTALSKELRAMNGYKDTSSLAEQCDSMANDVREKKYQELLSKKEKASHEDEFQNLYRNFLEIGDYKDAKSLTVECNKQYSKLKEHREEQERIERERHKAEELERQKVLDVSSLKKELRFILIGSIIGVVAVFLIYGFTSGFDNFASAILVGLWVGVGWGGSIGLVPSFFRTGRDIGGLIGGVLGFLLLYLLSGFAGIIWPLIRTLIKIFKIRKLQRNG